MRRRTYADTPTWRWSDLSYDMRVLTWWFRGNGGVEAVRREHPWSACILLVVATMLILMLVAAYVTGFSVDELSDAWRSS